MNSDLSKQERGRYVQGMFSRIAPRYDLMNRLMSAGQDLRWREDVIWRAELHAGDSLLDLGTGTGDLTREALRQQPACRPVSADFTVAMMRQGQQRPGTPLSWSAADALHLPFPDESFDAIVSGFLLRNVTDLQQALREMYRVLKPGGRFVSLETTPLRPSLIAPFVRFHMNYVIPLLGSLLTGQRDAYVYFPTTSAQFLPAETLLARLASVGFQQVEFQRRMLGTIAIHWGRKPEA